MFFPSFKRQKKRNSQKKAHVFVVHIRTIKSIFPLSLSLLLFHFIVCFSGRKKFIIIVLKVFGVVHFKSDKCQINEHADWTAQILDGAYRSAQRSKRAHKTCSLESSNTANACHNLTILFGFYCLPKNFRHMNFNCTRSSWTTTFWSSRRFYRRHSARLSINKLWRFLMRVLNAEESIPKIRSIK